MRRKALWVGILAVAHACLTVAAVLTSMSLAMAAFDGAREPTILDELCLFVPRVLMAPVVPLYALVVPRAWQRVPIISNGAVLLNSLVWAMAVVWLLERRSRRRAA
jgi:hypothetical protein